MNLWTSVMLPMQLGLWPIVSALQLPSELQQTSRRSVLSLAAASLAAPMAAHAETPQMPFEGGALAATCMGFGCNPYSVRCGALSGPFW